MQPITIYSSPEYNEENTIIKIDSAMKEQIKESLKTEDEKWGFHLERKYQFLNQYDNDDYLYVAGILMQVRKLHRLIYYNPYEKTWFKGYSEIPHLHLKFTENYDCKKNREGKCIYDNGLPVVNPKSLGIGVKPPCFNGTHVVEVNYYWLKQYITFLQRIFDDNEELIFNIEGNVVCADGIERPLEKQPFEYVTKEELLEDIKHYKKQKELEKVVPTLELYADSIMEGEKVQRPALGCWQKPGEKYAKIIGWIFYDENREVFSIDMKKKIYNTSGFAKYFKERNTLISEMFASTLQMILAHETAHVANGHWNLRMKKTAYSNQKDVRMVCELNADHTAIMWLINELLYEKDRPESMVLAYKREDLIYLWSVRIFSAYLALSWTYQDDDRVWTPQTLEDFQNNHSATHPPYQFRVYNMLNEALFHIEYICKKSEMAFASEKDFPFHTVDGHMLNTTVSDAVKKEVLNFIYSFEASFRESFNADERETEQKLSDSLIIETESRPDIMNKVPFLFVYMDRAKREFEEIAEKWSEVKDELCEAGVYRELKDRM